MGIETVDMLVKEASLQAVDKCWYSNMSVHGMSGLRFHLLAGTSNIHLPIRGLAPRSLAH